MNNSFILGFFVLINLLNLYNCASMNITVTKIKSDLDLNCHYNLSKTDKLSQFNLFKDKSLFYSFNNSTKKNPKFTKVPGVTNIKNLSPGHIRILNVDTKSSGNYTCQLLTNNNKTSIVNTSIVKIDSYKTNLKAVLVMTPVQLTKDTKQVNISCSTNQKFASNQQFVAMNITKGNNFMVIWKKNSGAVWNNKLPGVANYVTKSIKKMPTIPLLSFTFNSTAAAADHYQCIIVFRNSTRSYNTEIISNIVQLSSANSMTNQIILCLAAIVFINVLTN